MTGYADFEEFVVARRGALLRTAYLLTGNHHDAEDLVQSALIKVVPKWARIKDHPEGYVRQVLARESVNRWRGRRWREVTTDAIPETMRHPGVSADSADRIGLLEDLRRLSPRQRAVLVLRYFDDLTEADTAAALGISVGTVEAHVRDARAPAQPPVGRGAVSGNKMRPKALGGNPLASLWQTCRRAHDGSCANSGHAGSAAS
jgi:RNA polymerase sigma-70 factor (sigma-E family)